MIDLNKLLGKWTRDCEQYDSQINECRDKSLPCDQMFGARSQLAECIRELKQAAKGMVLIPAGLLSDVLDDLRDLRGERDWWKNEPRCNYQRDYEQLCQEIKKLEEILCQTLQ